jgi:drug/metabolite transporter (DMT)-like permease
MAHRPEGIVHSQGPKHAAPAAHLPSVPLEGRPTSGRARWAGALLIGTSAAGFAGLSIMGRIAFQAGLPLAGMLSLRFGGAAALLMGYLWLRGWRSLWPGGSMVLMLLGLGAIGYAGQSTLYFTGLQHLPASICSLVLYLYPAFVALLGWLFYHRLPARIEIAAMAVALLGVLLTAEPWHASAAGLTVDIAGLAAVIGSAIWYAGYIVLSDRVVHRAGALRSTAWITCGAALSFTTAGLLGGSMSQVLIPAALWILPVMILFNTILPLGTFLAGMARVGATPAALLSTLEPVFTVGMARLVLGERLSTWQAAGGLLVLAAAVLLNLPRRRPEAGQSPGRGHQAKDM